MKFSNAYVNDISTRYDCDFVALKVVLVLEPTVYNDCSMNRPGFIKTFLTCTSELGHDVRDALYIFKRRFRRRAKYGDDVLIWVVYAYAVFEL